MKTPVITMPLALKLAALAVTVLGLVTALDLAQLTNTQKKTNFATRHHHFSNMLGFFPAVMHRLIPKLNLTLGQAIATQLVDQT